MDWTNTHGTTTAAGFAALAVLALAAAGAAGSGRAASAELRPKVLYVTETTGFRHDVLEHSHDVMRRLAAVSEAFDVEVTEDTASDLTAERLAGLAAVVFYTTGELPMSEQQRADLLAFVKNGGGFMGIHSATDTFYEWPGYGGMIGGYFDGHPWNEAVTLTVEDPQFPGVAALAPSFEIADEIYQFRDWSRDDVHVVLSLDPDGTDMAKEGMNRDDGDYAVAWTRTYGDGRVYYNALGHRREVWDDPRFQTMLVEGLTWVMGE